MEAEQTLFEQLEEQNMSRDAYVALLEKGIADSEKMARLLDNKDFKDIFEDKYIKEFAHINAQNISVYKQETRDRITEKLVARSIFSKFTEQVINDGVEAERGLKDFRIEEANELKLQEDATEA